MLKLKTGEYLDKDIDPSSLYLEINEDGTKTLGFNISPYSDLYEKIENETSIFYEDLWYLVKEINEDRDQAEIVCSLDRDELKESIYESYKSESATELELIRSILNGTKWTVSGTSSLKRKTIEMEDVTKLDILIEISGIFECYLDFDNVNRIVYFSYPDETPYKGLFISEQVNLKKSSYTADSYDLVTRIYGFGKTDDETGNTVNFASINNGKNYVENLSYKNRIISKIIRDDRFTVPKNLLDYCQQELEKYSKPIEAFDLDIIDLAKLKEDEYYMYNFNVRDLVDYVDRKRNKRVRHRIVKYIIYPFKPEDNKITLSTNPINLESVVTSNSGDIKDLDKKTQSFLQQAQQAATELINSWATKGHVIVGENEIYVLDKLPKETAKYCIRINLGGIAFSQQGWQGPYVSAWTIDGKFNADFITAGTLKAINVEGVNIKGGTITGETAINVGTDLTVGDNIYVGQNQDSEYAGRKYINFLKDIGIRFSKIGENGSIRILGKGSASLSNQFGGYNTVVDANIESIYLDVYDSNGQLKNMLHVSKDNTFSSYQITVTSDKRLKENIIDTHLENLIDRVKIKQFDYISGQKNKIGVIAQDFIGDPFEKYVLSQDENGYYSVDYSVLYLAAIQKVQSLEKRLESLEKRLEEVIK